MSFNKSMKEEIVSELKIGDFVKHKANKSMIFQVVQILEPVDKKHPRMVTCYQVTDVKAFLETDLQKHELTDSDYNDITESMLVHNL